jgi:hypothetical protein
MLTSLKLLGQSKLPKNLKQAVAYFNKDCPDSVKLKIKTIHLDSLSYAVYPFANEEPYKSYKTISNWTSNDDDGNRKIVSYLDKKGVYMFHSELLLFAFREKLLTGELNERRIINKYKDKQNKYYEKEKVKFITDTIDGVYIPKDLEDCFKQIDSFWSDSTKLKVKNRTEDEFTGKAHFGFGMWMRNNWRLWGGSRLSKYFNELGIDHPDDMSGIILNSYHRYLNSKEINLNEQILKYKEYWKELRRNELIRKEDAFSRFKVGDTLMFNYPEGFVSNKQEEKYDDDVCIAKGIVRDLNNKDYLIKVKIIDACDRKGIIYYDNEDHWIFDKKTKRFKKPSKRIIKRVNNNHEQWFSYENWDTL